MAELSSWGRVSKGTLREGTPALYVTGVTDQARTVTDVLCVKNGSLSNIVLSGTTGVSRDIFASGAIEAAKFIGGVTQPGLYDMSCLIK